MMPRPSILVVDDDIVAAELLAEVLAKEGYDAHIATHPADAVRMGEDGRFDVVITDLRMPDGSGLDVMQAFKKTSPRTSTFVITAFGSFDTAIEAIKLGAYDYITKPFKMEDIKAKVSRCLEQKSVRTNEVGQGQRPLASPSFKSIIGSSAKMLEIYKTVARVSAASVPVLLQGESGTGKELIAKAIHDNSSRAPGPYVAVNCATLPENLLESELFGHMRGAFTGAVADKRGLFEEAKGGTCFLDEIGDLPTSLQAKLLRVLETNEIRRVGGVSSIAVDVRFIAATNKDLFAMVKTGQFRDDLFYRLQVVTITLPPLREHPEDIPLLADYFFTKAAAKAGKDVRAISGEVMEILMNYPWPGNIRQLENVVERAIALTNNRVILASDIPHDLYQSADNGGDGAVDGHATPFLTLEEMKADYIRRILTATGGNQIKAADILGIDRKTLYRILKKGLLRPRHAG